MRCLFSSAVHPASWSGGSLPLRHTATPPHRHTIAPPHGPGRRRMAPFDASWSAPHRHRSPRSDTLTNPPQLKTSPRSLGRGSALSTRVRGSQAPADPRKLRFPASNLFRVLEPLLVSGRLLPAL